LRLAQRLYTLEVEQVEKGRGGAEVDEGNVKLGKELTEKDVALVFRQYRVILEKAVVDDVCHTVNEV
jgi:hypothetical protein